MAAVPRPMEDEPLFRNLESRLAFVNGQHGIARSDIVTFENMVDGVRLAVTHRVKYGTINHIEHEEVADAIVSVPGQGDLREEGPAQVYRFETSGKEGDVYYTAAHFANGEIALLAVRPRRGAHGKQERTFSLYVPSPETRLCNAVIESDIRGVTIPKAYLTEYGVLTRTYDRHGPTNHVVEVVGDLRFLKAHPVTSIAEGVGDSLHIGKRNEYKRALAVGQVNHGDANPLDLHARDLSTYGPWPWQITFRDKAEIRSL